MVAGKTASLFQTCCEIGGVSAKDSQKQLEALKNYGFNLGMAFQVRDDILDIFGKEKDFGKKIRRSELDKNGLPDSLYEKVDAGCPENGVSAPHSPKG